VKSTKEARKKSRSRSRSPARGNVQPNATTPVYCHRCTKEDPKGRYWTGKQYGGYCTNCSNATFWDTQKRCGIDHIPTSETLANREISLICWSCGCLKSQGIHVLSSGATHPCEWGSTTTWEKEASIMIDGMPAREHWRVTQCNDLCLVNSTMRENAQNAYASADPKKMGYRQHNMIRDLGWCKMQELWGDHFDEERAKLGETEYKALCKEAGKREFQRICAMVYGETNTTPPQTSSAVSVTPSTAVAASAASASASSSVTAK